MRAFIFDDKDTSVIEHGDKIRVEEMSVGERQTECPGMVDKVSHPVLDFFTLINHFGAFKFFVRVEFANGVAIVMFVELIATLIKDIGGVTIAGKIKRGSLVWRFDGRIWQENSATNLFA